MMTQSMILLLSGSDRLKTAVKREMGLRKYVEANFEESMRFLPVVCSWSVMLTKSNLKPVKISEAPT